MTDLRPMSKRPSFWAAVTGAAGAAATAGFLAGLEVNYYRVGDVQVTVMSSPINLERPPVQMRP